MNDAMKYFLAILACTGCSSSPKADPVPTPDAIWETGVYTAQLFGHDVGLMVDGTELVVGSRTAFTEWHWTGIRWILAAKITDKTGVLHLWLYPDRRIAAQWGQHEDSALAKMVTGVN